MGKVWFEDSRGHKFHLPVVGEDVNTPYTAIHVSEFSAVGMMYSGTVAVAIPGHPPFTFDFSPPGRSGSCRRCGLCCTHGPESEPNNCDWVMNEEYGVHCCPHLEIDPRPNSLGREGRCSCAKRNNILDGYKGCALWPRAANDVYEWCVGKCGFSFSGG